MKLAELLKSVNLVTLVVRLWGTEATQNLHPDRGGMICDRRPGQEEANPSFSVYRRDGLWRWHRFGGDGASGTAYGLLLEYGYSKR